MLQYTHIYASTLKSSRMRVHVCRQDRTNRERCVNHRETVHMHVQPRSLRTCAAKGPKGSAPASLSTVVARGRLWGTPHLLRGAISHPRSSAGGHCPLMMRLTVSLSLHSATFCFPMLAPPPRSSRQGLLERRRAASAAACRVAHESRRGGSSAVPQPHALPLPPGSGAPGGPAAVGGVRPQSAQACSWLLRWALLCSALLCAPPSDSRRLACAAAYRSAHDDRRGEA